jgi:hypothetical protein
MEKTFFTFLLVLNLLFTAANAQIDFTLHQIDEFSDKMGQVSLVDIDKDGDLDFAFGQLGDMYWYEYTSASNWKRHSIGKGASTDVGGCSLDINEDRWIDFVAGDSWYENSGKPKVEGFALHRKNMINSHDNIAVDMDNDGIKDIVSVSNNPDHPVLAWYKIPKDYTQNWDYHKIGKGIHDGISPKGYADLDQDGDMDIVSGGGPLSANEKKLFLWENTKRNGTTWKKHILLEGMEVHELIAGDVDGDGDIDICSKPWKKG